MSLHPDGNPHRSASAPSSATPPDGPPLGAPSYQGAHPGSGAGPYGSAEELPHQLLALASEQNLGRLLSVCRPDKHIGYLALFALISLLPVPFLFGPAWIGGIFMGVICWPLAAVGLLQNPLVVRKLAKKRIYLYDHGFVHSDGKGALDAYRWDQISTVFQRVVKTSVNGISTGTKYLYTLTRTDGRKVKLTNFWKDIAKLGEEVNLRVSEAQLPAMRDALARGHDIQFGDITVNAAGVSGRRGTAPWSQISKVTVQDGQVSLEREGKFFSLSRTPASKIPNLPLFLHLVAIYQGRDVQPH